jgi:hypothetical protein
MPMCRRRRGGRRRWRRSKRVRRLIAAAAAGFLLTTPAASAQTADAASLARQIVAIAHPPLDDWLCKFAFEHYMLNRYLRVTNDADVKEAIRRYSNQACDYLKEFYGEHLIMQYIAGSRNHPDQLTTILEFISASWSANWLETYNPSYVRFTAQDHYLIMEELFACFFMENRAWAHDRQFALPLLPEDAQRDCGVPPASADFLKSRSVEIDMVDEIIKVLGRGSVPYRPADHHDGSRDVLNSVAEERADISGEADRFLQEFNDSAKQLIGIWDTERKLFNDRYRILRRFHRPQIEAILNFLQTDAGKLFSAIYQDDLDSRDNLILGFVVGTPAMDDFVAAHRDALAQMNLRD